MLITLYKRGALHFRLFGKKSFHVKERVKDLLLRARVVVRTSNMKISRGRLADYGDQNMEPKSVPHVQHDYFSSSN